MSSRLLGGVSAAAVVLASALLTPATASAAVPAVTHSATPATASLTYTPVASWWGTNGRVEKTITAGSDIYLAGDFDYLGPDTGYGVAVAGDTGQKLSATPFVNGVVNAAAPDGSGGWYIGGEFSKVGGLSRPKAAHISASGAVLRWNPRPNGVVSAIADIGTRVILGGSFSQIGQGSASVSNVAAVDPDLGAADSSWSASANGTVRAVVDSSRGLYLGGDFSSVDGASSTGLARVSDASGSFDSSFSGHTSGRVNAVAASSDGSVVVAGGVFGTAYGLGQPASRTNVAAFDAGSGAVLSWAPSPNAAVTSVAIDSTNGVTYIGGQFTSVSGTARVGLAQIGSTGAVNGFDAAISGCHIAHNLGNRQSDVPCAPEVDSLSISGQTLYVGGLFGATGATGRHDAVAFPLGSVTPNGWNPVASDKVLALAPTSSGVFVGGSMTSVGGLVRSGLAAIDATTGAGDPAFQADTDNLPLGFVASADGSRIYVYGHFSTVGGLSRHNLAALSVATKRVDPGFSASANQIVESAGFGGNALYVGGKFTVINSSPRAHLAKLDPVTGAVDPTFVVNTTGPNGTDYKNGEVEGLAVRSDGSKVYMGGPFTTINGQSAYEGIAVVDGTTGAQFANHLGGVGQPCGSIAQFITYLYLSPDQQRLYGGDECPDNIYQWDAVNLSTPQNSTGLIWRTFCDGGMQGAVETDNRFYYATHGKVCQLAPNNTQRVTRTRFAVFDQGTGALLPDAPLFDSPMGVYSLQVLPQGLLVGGDFSFAGARDNIHQGLALFPGTP